MTIKYLSMSWKYVTGQRTWGQYSNLREILARPDLWDSIFGGKDVPFMKVKGWHLSHKDFTTCFRGTSESPYCTCHFSNSYSLKFPVCQGDILWGVEILKPVKWKYKGMLILWGHHHPDTKTRQRQHKKRKLQANITDEHRCKNPQQNFSKQNSATHKKSHTPWSSWVIPGMQGFFNIYKPINVVYHKQIER